MSYLHVRYKQTHVREEQQSSVINDQKYLLKHKPAEPDRRTQP